VRRRLAVPDQYLLQVLQERTVTPVGSHEPRRCSGRVIQSRCEADQPRSAHGQEIRAGSALARACQGMAQITRS